MVLHKRVDLSGPPKPLVVSPSGTFDGDDGKWSTFIINIAGDGRTEGQNFRALMFTSSSIALVPAQTNWCRDDDCLRRRGIMTMNGKQPTGLDQSLKNYTPSGPWQLPFEDLYWWSRDLLLPETREANDTLGGEWGVSNVGLGEASPDSIALSDQYVVMHYVKDFFLASLGLSAGAVSTSGASKASFISSLASYPEYVPSMSYGFTAGASYHNDGKGAVGNMVFGGYDRSRLLAEQMTSIEMVNEQNNTLVVGVQSITYKADQNVEQGIVSLTTTEKRNSGFSAVIDSTFPYLVLPDDICDDLVEKFNLRLDNATGLYTVNETAHIRNQQQNATVSFRIGPKIDITNEYSMINFPYEAFYLQAGEPLFQNTTHYFPIKKSSNGLYILGRAFLQEAYVVVDYERANFSVAPAYRSVPMPDEDLVPIYNLTYVPPTPTPIPSSDGLSAGAIAGIVIGIVAVFALLGAAVFFFFKRRRTTKEKALEQDEKPGDIDTIAAGGEVKHRRVSELTGSEPAYSPQMKPVGYYGGDHKPIPELSPESHPAELYSPPLDDSNGLDYFAGPKPRRRGATRDSSGNNTPGTPVAELPGDDGRYQVAGQHFEAVSPLQRPKHSRGPSDNSLSTNIDEVLAAPEKDAQPVQRKHSSKFVEHTGEDAGPSRAEMVVSPLENTRSDERDTTAEPTLERRPSHARGLSDTTVNSESTAVSQLSPEELERWGQSTEEAERHRR